MRARMPLPRRVRPQPEDGPCLRDGESAPRDEQDEVAVPRSEEASASHSALSRSS